MCAQFTLCVAFVTIQVGGIPGVPSSNLWSFYVGYVVFFLQSNWSAICLSFWSESLNIKTAREKFEPTRKRCWDKFGTADPNVYGATRVATLPRETKSEIQAGRFAVRKLSTNAAGQKVLTFPALPKTIRGNAAPNAGKMFKSQVQKVRCAHNGK